jgi:hypothetical protein
MSDSVPREPRESFGDRLKRRCDFYACCSELMETWEDERGAQLECSVCGAAVFASNDLLDDGDAG